MLQYRTNTYLVDLGVFSIVFGQVQQDKVIPVQIIVKVQNISIESTPEFYKTELMDAAFKQAAALVKFDVSSKNCILKSVTLIDSGPQAEFIYAEGFERIAPLLKDHSSTGKAPQ